MQRYFAFGCSYTNHYWPTVADFIAIGFKKFYNLGRSGSSNSYILQRLFEAHQKYNFTSDDFITVATSGIGRFSYIHKDSGDWIHSGDLYPNTGEGQPKLSQLWAENFESYLFALDRSVFSLKMIRFILDNLNVKYKIYPAISYLPFQSRDPATRPLLKEYINLHDIKDSIDTFVLKTNVWDELFGYEFKDGRIDRHPSISQHHRYFKEYFPELVSPKTESFCEEQERNFKIESVYLQTKHWDEFCKKLRARSMEEKLAGL